MSARLHHEPLAPPYPPNVKMIGTDRRAVRTVTPHDARPARRSGPTVACVMVIAALHDDTLPCVF